MVNTYQSGMKVHTIRRDVKWLRCIPVEERKRSFQDQRKQDKGTENTLNMQRPLVTQQKKEPEAKVVKGVNYASIDL